MPTDEEVAAALAVFQNLVGTLFQQGTAQVSPAQFQQVDQAWAIINTKCTAPPAPPGAVQNGNIRKGAPEAITS